MPNCTALILLYKHNLIFLVFNVYIVFSYIYDIEKKIRKKVSTATLHPLYSIAFDLLMFFSLYLLYIVLNYQLFQPASSEPKS